MLSIFSLFVNASYNEKYDVINVNLIVDFPVESWQIDELGDRVDIKLVCETNDGLKKRFEFKDIELESGKNLTGQYLKENATLKDFVMVKSLLEGEVQISTPLSLSLNSKKREE